MSQPAPKRRRTREAPEVRRARILDEAIRLIGERGYYGFTVQELAVRCGLTNPGLLHYYPSKHELLLAALGELERRETELIGPVVSHAERQIQDGDGREAVLGVLRAIVSRGTASPEMVRFLVELQAESLSPDHPANAWWQRRETVMQELFQRLLHPFVEEPRNIARYLLALIDGLSLQWLRSGGQFDIAADWDRVLVTLLPELYSDQHVSNP